MKKVIITDENGNFVKEEEFDLAIQQKLIRRIVRIFVFNEKRELFVQKRGSSVKIWPSRWDSSAAGHVDPGETPEEAAKRELQEETGISVKQLLKVTDYYDEECEDGTIMLRAFATLYFIFCSGEVNIDGEEVVDGKWMTLEQLEREINLNPKRFSPGFISSLEQYKKYRNKD